MQTLKTIVSIIFIVVLAKVAGLLREVLTLRYLGAGEAGQAFVFASQIPRDFLDATFAAAITAAFIPVYNKYLETRSRGEADRLANNFNNVLMMATAIISVVGITLSVPIAMLYFGSEYPSYAPILLGIMFPMFFFTSVAFSFTGVLQSLGSFNPPSAMSLVFNTFVILYIFFGIEHFGVIGLAVSFLVGNILQLAFLIPFMKKRGFKFMPVFNLKDTGLREMFSLVPVALVSGWLFPVNSLINTIIVTGYDGSALVHFRASQGMYMVLTGVLVLSITNVMFPKLSKEAVVDKGEFAKTLSTALSAMVFILLPLSVGIGIVAYPIISLFYGGSEFSSSDIQATGNALALFAIGIIGFGLQSLLGRGFFALTDKKVPLIASVIAIITNTVTALFLVRYMGLFGVVIASGVGISAAALVMYVYMAKKVKGMLTVGMIINFGKMIITTIIMWFVLNLVRGYLSDIQGIFYMIIVGVVGVIIYATLAVILQIDEIKVLRGLYENRKGT